MKNSILKISILSSMILCSCATSNAVKKIDSNLNEFDVNVNINKITDKEISGQISEMLSSSIKNADLVIQIDIGQRNISKGISELNSIFTFTKIFDSEGNLLHKNGIYFETKNSLESSVEQYKLCKKISGNANNYIQKNKKAI